MKALVALLLLTMTIDEKDQAAIQGICDIAAQNSALNRDTRAAVANWCVEWEKRIAPPKPEPKK